VGKILGLIGVGEIGEDLGHTMEAEGVKLARLFLGVSATLPAAYSPSLRTKKWDCPV
jgi:hypothetical protein